MRSICVDDRQLVISRMQVILSKVKPEGEHHGFTDAAEAVGFAAEHRVDVAF